MKYEELEEIIDAIRRDHEIYLDVGEDNDGQIIFYTNLEKDEEGNLIPYER